VPRFVSYNKYFIPIPFYLFTTDNPTDAEVEMCFNQYTASLESSAVKSLDDIIEFNKANPDIDLPPQNPGQDGLITATESSPKEEDLPFLRDLFYTK